MPIERITNRSKKINDDQFTVIRAKEFAEKTSFGINWMLPSKDGACTWKVSKPIGLLQDALDYYEKRKKFAAQIELWEYGTSIEIIRRYCHIERCEKLYRKSLNWIYEASNPPYEIEGE